MKLTVSEGNIKIGAVPNISLTPGASCVPGVPCLGDGCYAMKSYRMYPNVRAAWDGNLQLWRTDPEGFMDRFAEYFKRCKPQRFRWHVGGDIPDQAYADMMKYSAMLFNETSFLCFTKRYELDLIHGESNIKFVLSTWPGLPAPTDPYLPTAWLAEDPRAPFDKFHIRCPGHCGKCDYKCWDILEPGMAVIFPKH